MKNIILIGLPGAGKSTIGVILAKTIRMNFIDTDIVIQEQTGKRLQEVIEIEGPEVFQKIDDQKNYGPGRIRTGDLRRVKAVS